MGKFYAGKRIGHAAAEPIAREEMPIELPEKNTSQEHVPPVISGLNVCDAPEVKTITNERVEQNDSASTRFENSNASNKKNRCGKTKGTSCTTCGKSNI